MKNLSVLLLPLAMVLPVFGQEAPPAAPGPLLPPPAGETAAVPDLGPFKDQKERVSYGLGAFLGNREKQNAASNPDVKSINVAEVLAGLRDGLGGTKSLEYSSGLGIAAQIKRSGVEIDAEVLAEALRAALENQPAKLDPMGVQTVMQEIQTEITGRQQAKQQAEAEENLAAAGKWLAENAKAAGVKVTPSGLQYTMDQNGEGRTPGLRDVVTVNLIGTTTEGIEFDRTAEGAAGRRAMMALPKGLQEGLQLMKVGGKARFWLPPALGFGETPRGPGVKANEVLTYTVELTAAEEPPANNAEVGGVGPDGQPLPTVKREPISAVTPPVSVEIPADGGPPRIRIEGQPEQPAATPPIPAPSPAPEEK